MQFTATLAALALAAGFSHAGVIAHSVNDFNFAMNDGIGVGGAMVEAGSALDAAQQGHTDSTNNGSWRYGFGRSGDGQAFSGGFPLLDLWQGSGWGRMGSINTNVGASFQAPMGGSITADPMSYRRWTSNGSFTGQMLTMQIRVTLSNELSDGVTLVVSSSGTVDDYEVLLPPESFGVEQVFTLDFIDGEGTWALAGIRPNGTGPVGVGDFFNDAVQIEMTIVPGPGGLGVLGCAGVVGIRRRRG